MTTKSYWRRVGVALLMCIPLSGCASSDPDSVVNENPAMFEDILDSFLKDARESDADPWQLTILEKGDEVSFVDYEAATGRTLQCMRDAGIDVLGPTSVNRRGVTELDYSWAAQIPGLTADQTKALGDDCIYRFSFWVAAMWQVQPSSIEAMERHFDQYREAVVACVRSNGGAIKDDATRDEALEAASMVSEKTGVDCFQDSGTAR